MLALLTRLTSINRKFKQAQLKQGAFEKIKLIVVRDTSLTYPYFNKTFKIHTNYSAFQLGAVIIHKFKPIAFYSGNLTGAQKWYTVTER